MKQHSRVWLAVAVAAVLGLSAGASPAAAAPVSRADGLVFLTVVPDLTGDTWTEARHALAVVGLGIGAAASVPDCDHLGLVAQQTPPSGTALAFGATVWVSLGVRPRPPAACR